jgi:predicted metalloprotease
MSRQSRLLAAPFALVLTAAALLAPAATSVYADSPGASATRFITSSRVPDIDAFWRQESRAEGAFYSTPRVVLFDSTHPAYDACDSGPVDGHAYCPADRTIYLDVGTASSSSFGRLWATDSNFTIVTIIAHEWGHAIQDQRQRGTQNLSRLQLEQQADCLSGVFAHYSAGRGWLEPGDLQAAEALALRSGDSGHGPGWRRALAFETGYYSSTLTPSACGLD